MARRRRNARMLRGLVATAILACLLAAHGAQAHRAASQTLVLDNSFVLDTIDPQRAFDPTSTIVDRALYDTLFTYRGNRLQHPVPLLVRSWTTSDDKTFTFQLRQDVHFADGTPLTAADVVFSLRRLVNLKGNPAFLLAGARISATGKYAVSIETAMPEAQLPSILADASTGIVNSSLVSTHGATDAADASTADTAESWLDSPASAGAGSGPYLLQSYEPTSQIVLRANPDYWGQKKPGFETIVLRNMPATTQLINVQRGAHEIAIDLSADQAQTLAGDAGLRVSVQPSPWVLYLFTNDNPQVSAITSNKSFQQAVRHALDYQALRAVAGQGAVQAPGLIPSMILGALPRTEADRQDSAEAREELAASGIGSRQVTLAYPSDATINGVSFATLAQRIQADLQAAGFNVALSGSPVAVFQPRFRAGQVAFGLWAWVPDYPDPADYLVFSPGSLVALHAGWSAGSDPAIAKIGAKALAATSAGTRKALYQQFQRLLNARGPFVPLIQPAQAFVATSDLAGASFSGAYDVDLTRVSPA